MIIENPKLPPAYENTAGCHRKQAEIFERMLAENDDFNSLTETEVAFLDTCVMAIECSRECANVFMRIAALSQQMIDDGLDDEQRELGGAGALQAIRHLEKPSHREVLLEKSLEIQSLMHHHGLSLAEACEIVGIDPTAVLRFTTRRNDLPWIPLPGQIREQCKRIRSGELVIAKGGSQVTVTASPNAHPSPRAD